MKGPEDAEYELEGVEFGRDDFEIALSDELRQMATLVAGRNARYGGDDPLKCWRKRGLEGLLIRIEDKVARFDTFLDEGATLEEWEEVLRDLAGYALCGLIWAKHGDDPIVE